MPSLSHSTPSEVLLFTLEGQQGLLSGCGR
jgi:hypothetical protein